MLEKLTTESPNPDSEDLDLLSTLELVQLINGEDAKVAVAVKEQSHVIASAVERIAACLEQGGRLIYVGAGTSGRLGVLDAVECPPTFGTRPDQIVGVMAGGLDGLVKAIEGAEDSHVSGKSELQSISLTNKDCVVGITASGRTPFVIGALAYARETGASTIGFCCNEESEIGEFSDILIAPIVGPEVISGSTRLKAGTATKMVLNILTTSAMVRLGKTYGNYMVDVQATNFKLQERATRMLVSICGLPYESAGTLLDSCDGELKTAVVAHQMNVQPGVAREKLAAAGGRLRNALLLNRTP